MAEELMQQLRSKATELLLREEWNESVLVYSQFIPLCQDHIQKTRDLLQPDPDNLSRLHKSLCLALSNRAEARSRLREFAQALQDCDQALKIESAHFKTLLCKGKILMSLNRYAMALDCFRAAQLDPQSCGSSESLNGYLEKCKKLEFLAKTGAFDISDWIASRFQGKPPELAEYIGPVQIRKSEISGRGLFATKNIDAGTLLFATKAVAIERSILGGGELNENAQLVMWKNFIDQVNNSASKCPKTRNLIGKLSSGEDEFDLEVPDISLFRPETEEDGTSSCFEKLDSNRVLSILDVNSIVEDGVSSKVLGKNSDYYGIGLWILACFINHSCVPNARRLHVGDHVLVHASRDVKAGEEVTFAYFDVLSPLGKRKQMSKSWGFDCDCKRCKFEEGVFSRQELREIEMGIERGMEAGGVVYRLEEGMRRWMVRGKEKGYLRASFWAAFYEAYSSEKSAKRWGRRLPPADSVVDSVAEAVGSDGRVLKILLERLKKSGGVVEAEKALKLGRGLYGKVMKKQAMKTLLDLLVIS
ncbi:N-terminal acetyltransferase A, auxiliary subunit [Parasponia andersonii]|uniref:N-terminal acetyltransferase A, auxiliary subunit n=1 Tax=Parasponia andersonii TaxID=3476 RepID=A0A2P5BZB9_PARAD|nr:N-terminal acetyltransferase A, auxiliary subunit [Parasponia andersonii]